MRIIVYLGHPAQYHFFKNAIRLLKENGNEVKILIKTKDILEKLLDEDGLDYVNIQNKFRKNSKFSILISSFKRTWAVYKIAKKFKADVIAGSDVSVAQAAKLLNIPALTMLEDDVDIIANLAKLTYPFTSSIVVPTVCRVGKWEGKKIPYNGYMKLAYLHPNYFKADENKLNEYRIQGEYCLIRLASLKAYHDVGINGLSIDIVDNLISKIQSHGYNVYISSEGALAPQLQKYQLKIKNTDIHHIMKFASLLISDSQSMSVESAMLGIPSIRFSDFSGRISVLEELEHNYKLTFGIKTSEPELLVKTVDDILGVPNCKEKYQLRREKMLNDKIDVTAFMVWFIENYPKSKDVMKENPDYQLRFK